MSGKVNGSGKAMTKVKLPEPRSLKEINDDYTRLCAALGDARYKEYRHTQEVERLTKEIFEVDIEASERVKLDKESAAASTPPPSQATEGVTDAQS